MAHLGLLLPNVVACRTALAGRPGSDEATHSKAKSNARPHKHERNLPLGALMPKVIGGRRTTYLLLSGITVPRVVQLAPGVDLLPWGKNVGSRPLLTGLDLLDRHFAMLQLPWIECQIRIAGKGGADVATRAWNALWDVLLLSAIFAVPVNCGLQSTAELAHFNEKSRLSVIDYRTFAIPQRSSKTLTELDCLWLESNFRKAQLLLTQHGMQNAVHCLATYHWHSLPRAQLALLWAGIEGIFGVDSEIAFRVSLYTAKFLAPDDRLMQQKIFSEVKQLYSVRSKAVHGGRFKGDPSDSVAKSVELLRKIIVACVEGDQLPSVDQLVL